MLFFLEHFDKFLECQDAPLIQMASSKFVEHSLNNSRALQEFALTIGLAPLCTTICSQLRKAEVNDSMAELAIKNLVGILPNLKLDEEYEGICKKLASVCKYEIIQHQNEAVRVSF